MTTNNDIESNWLRLINRFNKSTPYDYWADLFVATNINMFNVKYDLFTDSFIADDKTDKLFDPALLDGYSWVTAIINEPSLADECNWDKLSGDNWTRLLCWRPEFVGKCDFNKFDMQHWLGLIILRPFFASMCPWDQFTANDDYIIDLLEHCPVFADRLVWNRLGEKDLFELYRHHKWVSLTAKDKCRIRSSPNGFNLSLFHQPAGVIYVTK